MDVPCVQVNLRKSSLATGLFSHNLSSSMHIGFVTEPYCQFNKVVGKPKEYVVYPELSSTDSPRSALYIPKNIKCVSCPHLSNMDCQVAMITINHKQVLIASVYLDINLEVDPPWLYRLIEVARQKHIGVLIGMDSNAHSQLYGPDNNTRGDQLERFILQSGLYVENRGTQPTFQTIRAESNIDVTLSQDVVIRDWRVNSDYNASDHNSIYFSIARVEPLPPKEVRAWASAKWPLFTSDLKQAGFSIPETITEQKVDKMVEYLYHRLDQALDKACPLIKVKQSFKGSKWFNDKLKRLNIQVRKQYDRACRVETVLEWDKYHRIHKKFKRKCRKAKTNSWRHFVTETENEHKMSILARISMHKEKAQIHTLDRDDGSVTEPGRETLEELVRTHFPAADSELDDVPYDLSKSISKEQLTSLYNNYLSEDVVEAALLKFKPMKAPGPDKIKPVAFRYLPANVIRFILFIYKACLFLHYTPRLWQKATVIFLPKPGKKTYRKGKSYRPIVLSNFLLKGLERVITWRMEFLLDNYYPIHPKQHGFTKGMSTESAISNVVDYVERCLFRRKTCVGIFLDISSAYDSISIDHIRDSLYKHGGDIELVEWYYHYLSHRQLHMHLHGEDLQIQTKVGFPQGGVASAKFWLIAFDPAIQIINTMFVEGNGYADDCCIVFGGRKPAVMVRRIQRVLDQLVEWGLTCGLRFNPEKTVAVYFSRKKEELIPHLQVGGEYIPYSKSALYLGITLDSKLTWRAHLETRIAKTKAYMMKISNISKAIWGPQPKLSRWLYRCVVRPMIVYASVVWAHSMYREVRIRKLRKLNSLAVHTYTLFPRSLPIQGIELLTDTFPLHLWLQKEALCAYIRLADKMTLEWSGRNNNRVHNTSHRRYWSDKVVEYDLEALLLDVDECFARSANRTFSVDTNSFHKDLSYVRNLRKGRWVIFTDGSKVKDRVGAGTVIFRDNEKWQELKCRLPDTSSVYQAELYAIRQGLHAIEEALEEGDTVQIFSDSLSSLMALQAFEVHSLLVYRIIQKLNSLAVQFPTTLYWVKAHAGLDGNELADTLAKQGGELEYIIHISLPRNMIRVQVLKAIREVWKNEWEQYGEARHTKLFIMESSKSRGKIICSYNRVTLRRLFLALTNHNSLNYHMNLQDPHINPTCRFCRLLDETFDHLLICPSLEYVRQECGVQWDGTTNWEIDAMTKFVQHQVIWNALDRYELTPLGEQKDSDTEDDEMDFQEEDDVDDPPSDDDIAY